VTATTGPGPAVRRAAPDQLDELSRVFARAFADDPMIRWPFPDLPDPEAALQVCFRAWNASNIELGLVFEAAAGAGFAVWVPPDRAGTWLEAERLARRVIVGLTDDDGARYDRLWEWIEERTPAGPLWYLDQLGVDPSHQGEGLGRALVRFGLDRAAAAGLPAWLETARERNLGFYSSLGFRLVDDGTVPGGGPRIWFMRCDPAR
jgi:ribosomal protein S18 acetylase RimI-like enzyme